MCEESLRAKVRAELEDRCSFRGESLSIDGQAYGAGQRIADALVSVDGIDEDVADAIGFHLSDWFADGAFLTQLIEQPDRFTKDEISSGILAFLVHAPNHVAAAAQLAGLPTSDVFHVGVGARDANHDE